MRGKVYAVFAVLSPTEITPAYAGKRHAYYKGISRPKDHPRLCGEKLHEIGYGSGDGGSPPPMRGKAVFRIVVFQAERITPAYAGKSLFPP